jgi:hypothetical protein
MPDWQRLVREKLDCAQLPASQRDEIAAELATHLEELFEEQRARGLSQSEAREQALREVCDWNRLNRRIQRAKREEKIMNDRTKQLWMPGLAAFWIAMGCEVALGKFSAGAISGGHMFINTYNTAFFYSAWLLAQLACGALAAYLSRRAGGTRTARIGAALFTSAVLLTTMVIVITICAVGRATGLAFTTLDFMLLIKPVVIVVLVPSAAMLLGALPFLSEGDRAAAA